MFEDWKALLFSDRILVSIVSRCLSLTELERAFRQIFFSWTSQLSDADATTIAMSANSIVDDFCWKNSRPKGKWFFIILRYDDVIREIWLCAGRKKFLIFFYKNTKEEFSIFFKIFSLFSFIFSEIRYEYKL